MAVASLAQGIAFAIANILFIYAVLAMRGPVAGAPPAAGKEVRGWLRQPLLVFVLLAIALIVAMALVLRYQAMKITAEAQENIAAIGELKARQLELWLEHRTAIAVAGQMFELPRLAATQLSRKGASPHRGVLQRRLDLYVEELGLVMAAAIGTSGATLASAGESQAPEPATLERVGAVLRTGQPMLHVLHKVDGPPARIYLDYVIPWRAMPDDGSYVGALLLRHDVQRFLFPLMQSWPTSSGSAETLLVRREGDEVLFLNELRHRADSSFVLRRSIADERLASARFLRSDVRSARTLDYRGVEVVAAGRPIRDTDWLLVAKVDVYEALASVREQAVLYGLLMLGLTLLVGVGATALWRQQAALGALRERGLLAEHDALGKHLQLLSRHAHDIVLLLDASGRIVSANDRALQAYGRTTLAGVHASELRPRGQSAQFEAALAGVLREGSGLLETTHRHADGTEFPVEISAHRIDTDGGVFVQAIIRDLTERRRAEQDLGQSEARFRAMVEQSISGIYVIQDGRFTYVNPRMAEIFGYASAADVIGRAPEELVAPPDRATVRANIERRISGQAHALAYTFRGLRKDGSEIEIGVHGSAANFGGRAAIIGALQDISERSRLESERRQALDDLDAVASRLRKVNRALRTLSAGNETLVRATDESGLLESMCSVIVRSGGYRFAAVGYVQPGEGQTIAPQASAGIPFEELRDIPMPRADPEHRLAPDASAIAKGAPQLHLDPASDPQFAPWRDLIVRHELASAVSMPLRASAHSPPYGVLVIGASDRDAFDAEAIKLLEELANDLSFGIGILRLREDQHASAAALRKSLEDTILAIAATTEMRDPYTAGHERRVAEVAACIAREMGFAEPAIEGIRFGAMIHDLGKIKIPAEILVKPTRLTPIEYELIKQHAQAGYDILKGIDFPWPVAQMVLQHHERIDGSGYPQGLKSDAIIREARILAVADTVEAMSSHRPYRPGLGLDKALAEIERGRGTLYDPAAVDACLRLFREKGYTLPA